MQDIFSSSLIILAAGLQLTTALPTTAAPSNPILPKTPPSPPAILPSLPSSPFPPFTRNNNTPFAPLPTTTNPKLASHTSLLSAASKLVSPRNSTNETFANVGSFETEVAADPETNMLGEDYENGLYTGKCYPITVIYARGTLEQGNVGFLAGPPFFNAIRALVGPQNVAVQGVDYPAVQSGFFQGGDSTGATLMATYINAVMTACPYTKLCVSGYSQGGQIVHKAATFLPTTTMALVSSVVIFGDPYYGYAVNGVSTARTLVLCHTGDDICAHGDLVLAPHMNYAGDALSAAEWVVYNAYKPNGIY